MHELTDEELVAKYRSESEFSGREAYLNELFQRHHARVATWCLRQMGDRDLAVDLAQEIFIKAYRHLDSFRGESKFSTWLYSITRNHCRNEIKSRSSRPDESSDIDTLNLADLHGDDAYASLERQSLFHSVRELMRACLTETEARVMTLHFADEMPLDAITRMLGLKNTSGAKAYIVSAKRKLNAAIARRDAVRRTAGARHAQKALRSHA